MGVRLNTVFLWSCRNIPELRRTEAPLIAEGVKAGCVGGVAEAWSILAPHRLKSQSRSGITSSWTLPPRGTVGALT
jgi:hypothetical protein